MQNRNEASDASTVWIFTLSPLEDEVHALAQTVIAGGVDGRLLGEVGVELRDVVGARQRRLERGLQLPVDDISPVDVLEVRVLLDGVGVGGAAAKALSHLGSSKET